MSDFNDAIEKYKNEMLKMISERKSNDVPNQQPGAPAKTQPSDMPQIAPRQAIETPPMDTRDMPSMDTRETPPVETPEMPPMGTPETPPVETPEMPPMGTPEMPPMEIPEMPPMEIPGTETQSPPEVMPPSVEPGSNIVMNSIGYLQAKTFTALDALPVPEATVVISRTVGGNRELMKVVKTNLSGDSQPIPLPTVSQSLSEVPGNKTPFATYDLEITKEGFIPIISRKVPVFENVITVQNFEMVALPEFSTNAPDTIIQNNEPDL